ncbi:Predicted chitinase [Thiothrix eikelboomii]|uniref:Predicted chitinase n=1 Tax=Thiothrix eikelboomii TaxID=92487 RepID=A0A1T4WV60_9GAMM|nr:glycoside hydrolase family 19 protein [Thiothrix eikelboomii]SKA81139.1 Predicted chitinase [Thiothrix eikelboomii]
MNRNAFFTALRGKLFKGFTQEQTRRIEAILDEVKAADYHHPYGVAYLLATAHHESDKFRSYREYGDADYFKKMYDIEGSRPKKARELGNLTPGDGAKFAGGGPSQLTGRKNYQKQGNKLGLDLLNNPELAARDDIAARILVRGMIDGDFTGKKLSHYFTAETYDFWGARRMINGTDKAALIAGYAEHYLQALIAASEPIKTLAAAIKPDDTSYA